VGETLRRYDVEQNIETLKQNLWWARTMEMPEAERQLSELLQEVLFFQACLAGEAPG